MKKLFALVLVLMLVITVCCGCGDSTSIDTDATEKIVEETSLQTDVPTQSEAESYVGLYVSQDAQGDISLADYVEIKENNVVQMQFNLLEAMAFGTGTYTVNDVGVLTFSEIVTEAGLVLVNSGSQFYQSDVGVMMIQGVEEGFALQGWNAPLPYRDGSLFISAD